MIRVEGLSKDYGSRQAINDLHFHANKGEILGFLGPNGAGKTTTMRILTGFIPPTSGKAEIGGFDVVEDSLEIRKIVGYLPETVPLYTDMTVYDYLRFMGELRRTKNIEDRVFDVLELLHLEDRAYGYIGKLSKGMRQRVGLAQALIHQPEVLILDEPTIGLDPAQIIEVRNIIKNLGKEKTILLSTHILPEAQQICDRVLIINRGKIVAEDTPERLQARITGAQRVSVQIRGEIKGIVNLISSIPGVISVVVKDEDTLEYETAPGKELRPDVAKAIVQAGSELLCLTPASLSLEEIFLQLTREEPPDPTLGETPVPERDEER